MTGTYIFFLINSGIAILFFLMEGTAAKVIGILLLVEGIAYFTYKWRKLHKTAKSDEGP